MSVRALAKERGISNPFRKENAMRILFSNEKMFDVDGIYNAQNQRIWANSRVETDERDDVQMRHKFPQKVMI